MRAGANRRPHALKPCCSVPRLGQQRVMRVGVEEEGQSTTKRGLVRGPRSAGGGAEGWYGVASAGRRCRHQPDRQRRLRRSIDRMRCRERSTLVVVGSVDDDPIKSGASWAGCPSSRARTGGASDSPRRQRSGSRRASFQIGWRNASPTHGRARLRCATCGWRWRQGWRA